MGFPVLVRLKRVDNFLGPAGFGGYELNNYAAASLPAPIVAAERPGAIGIARGIDSHTVYRLHSVSVPHGRASKGKPHEESHRLTVAEVSAEFLVSC